MISADEIRAAYRVIAPHVSRTVLVPDASILDAQARLWSTLRVVAEPGGAAALAALLSGRYVAVPDERVGVLICGGNTSAVRRLSADPRQRSRQAAHSRS